jgi:hypothetical protein
MMEFIECLRERAELQTDPETVDGDPGTVDGDPGAVGHSEEEED